MKCGDKRPKCERGLFKEAAPQHLHVPLAGSSPPGPTVTSSVLFVSPTCTPEPTLLGSSVPVCRVLCVACLMDRCEGRKGNSAVQTVLDAGEDAARTHQEDLLDVVACQRACLEESDAALLRKLARLQERHLPLFVVELRPCLCARNNGAGQTKWGKGFGVCKRRQPSLSCCRPG